MNKNKNLKNETDKERTSLKFNLTFEEKAIILKRAKECGLGQGEYTKAVAMGYTPPAVPPKEYYILNEKLSELIRVCPYKDQREDIETVLKKSANILEYLGRERNSWR